MSSKTELVVLRVTQFRTKVSVAVTPSQGCGGEGESRAKVGGIALTFMLPMVYTAHKSLNWRIKVLIKT